MEEIKIDFPEATPMDAPRLAEDLATFFNERTDGTRARLVGGSNDTMDAGATVVLLLGTPAVIILARGIADWIRRQGDPSLVITTKKGAITVKGALDLEAKREIIRTALENGSV